MLLSNTHRSEEPDCHERPSPAESGWNRSSGSRAPAHCRARARPPRRTGACRTARAPSRTGWPAGSPTSRRSTNSPSGWPARHPRRRAARDCCAPAPPSSAPGAVSSSSNRPTARAREHHHRPRPRPCRPRRTSRRCRAAPPPTARILDGARPDCPGGERLPRHRPPDLLGNEDGLDPRHREVAARLGYAASYALPLATEAGRPRSARPSGSTTSPPSRPSASAISSASTAVRHRAPRPAARAGPRPREPWRPSREELLPSPAAPGRRASSSPSGTAPARAAAATGTTRCRCPRARWAWPSASVTGSGPERGRRDGAAAGLAAGVRRDGGRGPGRRALRPGAAAAADRARPLRHRALRLLRARRCARSLLAGAGHCPPLVVGERRTEFVETIAVRAAGHARLLGGAERGAVAPSPERRVLLYTDGLLHRTGDPMDRAFARLHAAAAERPAGRCATTRAPSPTTCCARCCRTAARRTDAARGRRACSRPASSDVVRWPHASSGRTPLAPSGDSAFGARAPSARPYDGVRSSAVSRRHDRGRGAHPGRPRRADAAEPADEQPIKQRKNGLYPGVSDELAENMKSGWADTELHDLEPDRPGRAHRRPPRRALRALPGRAPGRSPRATSRPARTTPSTPSAPPSSTRTSPATRPRTASWSWSRPGGGHDGDALPAAALRPGERRVLAVRPGRAVGRPAALASPRPSSCYGMPCRGRPRAGRRAARGHRPGAGRARLRRRHRGAR